MLEQKIIAETQKFIKKLIDLYKFPEPLFLDIYKIEIIEEEKVCNVFVKVNPVFEFKYPIITPADFVLILQKLIPSPAFQLENISVYVYFVLGEVKKAQTEPIPVTFSSDILIEALDRIAQPILESKTLDVLLGYWVARGVASKLSDIFEPKGLEIAEEISYDGKAVVYK